jgi:hypothetical protein
MTQQFLENHQTVQQKRTDFTIDEHFRKSLGDNYHNRCLTPDDSSSNSSIIEQTTSGLFLQSKFSSLIQSLFSRFNRRTFRSFSGKISTIKHR